MKRLIISAVILLAAYSVVAAQRTESTVSLEGQIVCCTDCWAKADRKTTPYGTASDLAQAATCIGNGDATLLAVMNTEGATTFYQLEQGKFKRPGKNWLGYVGKRVEVTGSTRSKKMCITSRSMS